MVKQELIDYWIKAAELDLPVIDHLFEKGDYVWSLYLCHLVLEKILKAHYAKDNDKIAPKTHDLLKLVQATKLNLDENKLDFIDVANEFNIEARYPEDKFKFYQTSTK